MAAATLAILVIPPIITNASKTESTHAVISGSRLNVVSRPEAMAFICGRFPVPNELRTVANANITANHFAFKPLSM